MLCEAALFASYHVNICIGSSAGDLFVWTFGNVALSRGSSSSCGTRGKLWAILSSMVGSIGVWSAMPWLNPWRWLCWLVASIAVLPETVYPVRPEPLRFQVHPLPISGSEPFSAIPQKLLCPASSSPTLKFPKQCGNTWGSYGSGKKPGWLDRGGGRGSVHNSSLFSWFRACMFVSSVNFRSFRGGRADARRFCL